MSPDLRENAPRWRVIKIRRYEKTLKEPVTMFGTRGLYSGKEGVSRLFIC
jgi:hypothetical protein